VRGAAYRAVRRPLHHPHHLSRGPAVKQIPAVSDPGRTVAFLRQKSGLGLWEVAAARLRRSSGQRPLGVYSMAFTPNGRALLTACNTPPDHFRRRLPLPLVKKGFRTSRSTGASACESGCDPDPARRPVPHPDHSSSRAARPPRPSRLGSLHPLFRRRAVPGQWQGGCLRRRRGLPLAGTASQGGGGQVGTPRTGRWHRCQSDHGPAPVSAGPAKPGPPAAT
jgi:hypothetical protein